MRIGVVVFPGSNCDRDVHHVLNKVVGVPADFIWHKKSSLDSYDALVIPGGFAYGDRLRAGAIAAHSPVIKEVTRLARDGVPVLGICNGFQVLVEAGLLPGALMMNSSLRFVCKWTGVRVRNAKTPFTSAFFEGQEFDIPVAHGEGRYVAEPSMLEQLKKDKQIVLQYCRDDPNGSSEMIAAVCNKDGNVMGMMPHPERSSEQILSPTGSNSAMKIFESLFSYLKARAAA